MLTWPDEGEYKVESFGFQCSGIDRMVMEYASCVGCFHNKQNTVAQH